MRKSILISLMTLPFNLCIYALVFPVMTNSVLASSSPAASIDSPLLKDNTAIAHFSSFPNHDLIGDKLASRDEQQPGRECILIGRCRG